MKKYVVPLRVASQINAKPASIGAFNVLHRLVIKELDPRSSGVATPLIQESTYTSLSFLLQHSNTIVHEDSILEGRIKVPRLIIFTVYPTSKLKVFESSEEIIIKGYEFPKSVRNSPETWEVEKSQLKCFWWIPTKLESVLQWFPRLESTAAI